ncbi:MAG: RNA methyltransferase [Bacteroidetes bacterium]|nr:RNA methyltransferase [Bacteroidota bacterium]
MYGKFLVEGDKPVRELLKSNFKVDTIYKVQNTNYETRNRETEVIDTSEAELKKISTHENPNLSIAVAQIPTGHSSNLVQPEGLYIVCDSLNDPGNAGSIIRIADWFGIQKIFFSEHSVEVYNPKTVSAAKGSLFRVECVYTDLKNLFEQNKNMKVFGTFMKGNSVYTSVLDKNGFILIGNEANGISDELIPFVNEKISIPSFGKAESLNAAVAAGIVVSEFRRQLTIGH